MTNRIWFGVGALVLASCMAQGPSAYPLYPNPEHPRRDDEVGVLNGPIAVLDGQEVADLGQTFALLPGCHSFRLLRTMGDSNMSGAAYVRSLPQQIFALRIESGHFYSFDATVPQFTAPVGSYRFGFSDRGANGSVIEARYCDPATAPVAPKPGT